MGARAPAPWAWLSLWFAVLPGIGCGRPGVLSEASGIALLTNEEAVTALLGEIEPAEPRKVFRKVFSALPARVVVYPTENYYYFQFVASGRAFLGSIRLSAYNRDQGILGFSYIERVDKLRQPRSASVGGGANLTAREGVLVRKVTDWAYDVEADGRTVRFLLYEPGLQPPRKARLEADETYVGPSFDESGLQFFLVFNRSVSRLYWILNEEGIVPEEFLELEPDVLLGKRTEFAFYPDRENHRKILVGVHGLNVLQNNWYDGPFDQMPDNYVYTGQVAVREYLEAGFPECRGRIDKYGRFLQDPETRIPVGNCTVYFSKKDLGFVSEAKAQARSKAEFYGRITRQVFVVPAGLGDEVHVDPAESRHSLPK